MSVDYLALHKAFRDAEKGEPYDLIAYVRMYGADEWIKERLAAWMQLAASRAWPAVKESPGTERLARAALYVVEHGAKIGFKAAGEEASRRYRVKEASLDNALSLNRSDVNQWLKRRGILHLLRPDAKS